MTRYAERTKVSLDNSRAEVERTLERYGADNFAYGWDREQAILSFRANRRQIKFVLPLPDKESEGFRLTPSRKSERSKEQARAAWEQACRQRWRALALYIKGTLEAIESGIVTFERAFEAQTMLPDGSTVGDFIQPQITRAYEFGVMPAVMPGLKALPARDQREATLDDTGQGVEGYG